ncbi:hypothetical protein HGA91_06775 [candidate division WWE3 bacterium]|nr:hypothetical protein [candidate division WWE3 bacterium]
MDVTERVEQTSSGELGTEKNPLVVKPEKHFERPVSLISWHSPSRVFKQRTPAWFLSLIVLSLGLIAIFILLGQWSLVLVTLAVDFMLFAMNLVQPEVQFYALLTTGIQVGKHKYGYDELKSFWFSKDDSAYILQFSTYMMFPPTIEMTLPMEADEGKRAEIEETLLKYLPYEEGKRRNWVDYIEKGVAKVTPWMPAGLVKWYSSVHTKRLEPLQRQ